MTWSLEVYDQLKEAFAAAIPDADIYYDYYPIRDAVDVAVFKYMEDGKRWRFDFRYPAEELPDADKVRKDFERMKAGEVVFKW